VTSMHMSVPQAPFWTNPSTIADVGRPRTHSDDAILDAALEQVLHRGARATTIDAIAAASGAPKGSLYHRFESLNDLLAEMWIRAIRRSQNAFLAELDNPDAMKAALAAAVSLYDFSDRHRADARLLASMRREDLIEASLAPRLQQVLVELNRPIQTGLTTLARRLFGRSSRAAVEATITATADIPLGALRRHLIAGSGFPPGLRDQIRAAARAALVEAGATVTADK
jgi:AcrR family transcriptional regulator